MNFKRDKFLIVGISKSGTGACELLLSKNAKCYIYDDGDSDLVNIARKNLTEKGCVDVKKEELSEFIEGIDVVVLSPGVAIDHDIPIRAKKLGKRIIGELELASMFCMCPIIGVTGTNGKTTTCAMIDGILKGEGIDSVLCGNVGTPMSTVVDKLNESAVAVVEVSSFQLETTSRFNPHIAVILNVTPDHLSRHYNMENYLFIKGKILQNLRESEYAVLCYDDLSVRKLGEKTRAKTLYFSVKSEVNGAYLSDGKIYFKGKYITDISNLPVGGEHNILNVLAAVCVAEAMGISEEVIEAQIKKFKGVKHRIQFVTEVDGVEYFNDSKATNADATQKAIEYMNKPTVLIMGGKDKGLCYDQLFEKIALSKVAHVVLTGESRYRMLDSAKKVCFNNVSLTADFCVAIEIARKVAKQGQAVLFSPACSSFDCFRDFEERGDKFMEIVNDFEESQEINE